MSTPQLQLETLFVLDRHGRIVCTREPGARPGPIFTLIRGSTSCAWAVRTDAPAPLFEELDWLAQEEPPTSDFRAEPVHAGCYRSLVGGQVTFGPAFVLPQQAPGCDPVQEILDEDELRHHFHGWADGEIAAGRSPVMAVIEQAVPVSLCCCARRSAAAAEAGLETAASFRGRGFGPRVTLAWASRIRASGLTPLYSTSWNNRASLAVARKLSLVPYASDWSIGDED